MTRPLNVTVKTKTKAAHRSFDRHISFISFSRSWFDFTITLNLFKVQE